MYIIYDKVNGDIITAGDKDDVVLADGQAKMFIEGSLHGWVKANGTIWRNKVDVKNIKLVLNVDYDAEERAREIRVQERINRIKELKAKPGKTADDLYELLKLKGLV